MCRHICSLVFVLGLVLVSLGSAECLDNNDFSVGDEINVCAVGCQYRNESNLSQIISCDESVECRLTSFYPNGSLISAYQTMDYDGSFVFNYSLGNSSDLGDAAGVYTSWIDCYREKGWSHVEFQWSLSEEEEYVNAYRSNPTITSNVISSVEEAVEEKSPMTIGVGLLVTFLFLLMFLRKKDYVVIKKDLKFKGGK